MEQAALNFEPSGAALRDIGMQRAVDHADREMPTWSERALGYFKEYAASHDVFATEAVRAFAEQCGLPRAPEDRAWGAVARAAAMSGVVRRVGYMKTESPSSHRMTVSAWSARTLG